MFYCPHSIRFRCENHDSCHYFWIIFFVKIKKKQDFHLIMPLLEFKSFEKLPKKKPFRFLSGVFRRGGSEERELEITEDMLYGTEAWSRDREVADDTRAGTPAGHLDIEEEMETLHLSRRDNPYLSSCEALDDVCGDTREASLSPGAGSLGSPPRPSRQASLSPPDSGLDPVSPPTYRDIMALHSHLVRLD